MTMGYGKVLVSTVVVCSMMVEQSDGFPAFPALVPNGNVRFRLGPLGHIGNAPPRNFDAFAARFAPQGQNPDWLNICQDDFDGDGLTNGQELGDPNCEFPDNQQPLRLTDITNPLDPNNEEVLDLTNGVPVIDGGEGEENDDDDDDGFNPAFLGVAGAVALLGVYIISARRNVAISNDVAARMPVVSLPWDRNTLQREKRSAANGSAISSVVSSSNPRSRAATNQSNVSSGSPPRRSIASPRTSMASPPTSPRNSLSGEVSPTSGSSSPSRASLKPVTPLASVIPPPPPPLEDAPTKTRRRRRGPDGSATRSRSRRRPDGTVSRTRRRPKREGEATQRRSRSRHNSRADRGTRRVRSPQRSKSPPSASDDVNLDV